MMDMVAPGQQAVIKAAPPILGTTRRIGEGSGCGRRCGDR